jgi:hypothetical protein
MSDSENDEDISTAEELEIEVHAEGLSGPAELDFELDALEKLLTDFADLIVEMLSDFVELMNEDLSPLPAPDVDSLDQATFRPLSSVSGIQTRQNMAIATPRNPVSDVRTGYLVRELLNRNLLLICSQCDRLEIAANAHRYRELDYDEYICPQCDGTGREIH